MIRNLKTMGLALVALFVFSALAASAASAQNGRLTSDGPVTLDMTEIAGQLNAFTKFGGSFQCPGSTLTGHRYNVTPHELIPSGSEIYTLTPDYNQPNCVAIEGGTTHKATMTMNGCDYVLHVGATTGQADTYSTTLDIVCPAGQSIIDDVYFSATNENLKVCETTIGPQNGLAGATIKDTTTGDLELHGTYTGLSESKSGVCGAGNTTTGEFHVNLTVNGTSSGGAATQVGLSHI